VLLASCLTQGIGWLFGPFITFAIPTASAVLSWIFVIFNGLEGLWTTILYIIIQSQHKDEQKSVNSVVATKISKLPKSNHYKRSATGISRSENDNERQRTDVKNRNAQQEIPYRFNDLNDNDNDDVITSYL
jgi:hypothetical protein